MARQPSKPPPIRVSGWEAAGYFSSSPRVLTDAQKAEARRKRADVYEKLRQMAAAERDRRR